MATAYLFDPIFLKHKTGWGHPEKPERLEAINSAIASASFYKDLVKVGPVVPDMKYLEMIHSPSYIQRVKKEIKSGVSYLDSMDTAVCGESYEVALMAVGGSLNMCDTVMKGAAANGFCAVRPPGHHAEKDYAAGFCIFNNIAIAAKYLQSRCGIKRIAVVDWDVHHGNGTQHSFERDSSVLYISLHQFPHYPGTGSAEETGAGKGAGYTMNIPMHAGSGDEEYLTAFQNRIIPSLEKFKPEIILISAGFDGHKSDPLSSIRLSSDAYAEFTNMLMAIAGRHGTGRIIAFLEGGYNLSALSESVLAMMEALVRG
ncbi:MAG: histone deacetylase [Spirochaetes bacterium RBG_16_49_21]|nr:MAG: histone deacetylase [Spirochaetes bacterium RBG_16_49_21]